MESRRFLVDGKPTHLLVYEDGRVWSTIRNRFLSPQVNSAGYLWYNVTYWFGKAYLAHTLVALTFLGPRPPKHEINHKDLDKRNNHWSNLEWVTHSYNLLHARKIKPWHNGVKKGWEHTTETKVKMSRAKLRPIRCIQGDKELLFNSIEEFVKEFKTYRKKFNRVVNSIKTIDGWLIRYA